MPLRVGLSLRVAPSAASSTDANWPATATLRGPAEKSLNERTLNNAGTLVWTDSGGIAGLNGAVINNLAGGVFELRGDAGYGYMNFVGAIPTFNNLGTLRKTGSAGTSRFYADVFTNRGRVALEQQFTQTAEGVLEVRLAGATPGSGYGRLITGDPATLAGALSVRRMDGYEAALGEVFTPLTYGGRSGGFDTIEGWAIGQGMKFIENYGAGAFTRQVVPE